MKIAYTLAIALLGAATPALSQTAAPASAISAESLKGAMILSADGRRIGRVDRLRDDAITVIYSGRIVAIPVSTLTASDKGFTSTLTRAEIGKL